MSIDWKYFSKTKGYQSLKKDYVKTSKNSCADWIKREKYKAFRKVIDLSIYHAHQQGKTPWDILDEWEKMRKSPENGGHGYSSWVDFYRHARFQREKVKSKSLKPVGVRGIRKRSKGSIKSEAFNHPVSVEKRKNRAKKRKWTPKEKELGCRIAPLNESVS